MPTTTVLMYSFKGGSGRTVTTANVAYLLASEFHKRVLVIDLDVESAGSSVLFGVEKEVHEGKIWAIDDVLRGKEFALHRADFESALWPRMHKRVFEAPSGGSLDVLPARIVLGE